MNKTMANKVLVCALMHMLITQTNAQDQGVRLLDIVGYDKGICLSIQLIASAHEVG